MTTIGLFGQEIDDAKKTQDISFINAMNFFKDTPKTEAAFFLRFQILPVEMLKCLESYYNTCDSWKIFNKIKNFWNIHT